MSIKSSPRTLIPVDSDPILAPRVVNEPASISTGAFAATLSTLTGVTPTTVVYNKVDNNYFSPLNDISDETLSFLKSSVFDSNGGFTYNSTTDTLSLDAKFKSDDIQVGNLVVTGNVNLGSTTNIKLTGGKNNQVLVSDGMSGLKWGAELGYADSNVYNLLANFQGSFGIDVGNIHISGGTSDQVLATDGSGTLSWISQDKLRNELAGGNTYIQFNDDGVHGASPSLKFNKDIATLFTSKIATSSIALENGDYFLNANNSGISFQTNGARGITINSNGITFDGTGNLNLGNIQDLSISGGNNTQVLSTDGAGNLSWVYTVAGANTQIQFNDDGILAGATDVTYDKTSSTFSVSNLVANNISLGNQSYIIKNEFWYQAQTSSTANAIILSMTSSNISGLDMTIVATNGTTSRKISKILVATLGSVTNHSEYSTKYVGPNTGDFDVNQIGQNIVLSVKPTTANTVVYNMIVTTYKD